MMIKKFCFLTFSLLFLLNGFAEAKTPETDKAIERFDTLNFEIGQYGGYAQQMLLRCSQLQEAWVGYLHDVDELEEYYKGMEELYRISSTFLNACKYSTTVINFFNPYEEPFLLPQTVDICDKKGIHRRGFLNTFKTGRQLTAEEREQYFEQEMENYTRDAVVAPFTLNEKTLLRLEPEILYNFTLLSNGTIRASLERPGSKEYHVADDNTIVQEFSYPNHTILAGSPHQPVYTAGSFILFQVGEKRLFFVSNKSGHFAPDYDSLEEMRDVLAQLGVNKYTVIPVPDVDIAQVVLKLYRDVQVPISMSNDDAARLFSNAQERWLAAMDSINTDILKKLSEGDLSVLTPKVVSYLNQIREEATYIRSAYHLFSYDHEAPKQFHSFVKSFGKLKDGINHEVPEVIQTEATRVLEMLTKHEDILRHEGILPTDEASFREFLNKSIEEARDLLAQGSLSDIKYHDVKKWSRELGVFFLFLAQDTMWEGNGYFLYRAASREFFQTNEWMSEIYDEFIRKKLHGELGDDEVELAIPEKVITTLYRLFDALRIPPLSYGIQIIPENSYWLINSAKEWYQYHATMSKSPEDISDGKYDPRQKEFLLKLSTANLVEIEGEDERSAIAFLQKTLRFVLMARNAVLFLDAGHAVDDSFNTYVTSLQRILNGVQYGRMDLVREDALQMLEYISCRGVPTLALEDWVCTDQESFDHVMQGCLDDLMFLLLYEELALHTMFRIADKAQMIADLMNLFRRAGVDYQTLPTVCYDKTCEVAGRLAKRMQRTIAPYFLFDVVIQEEYGLVTGLFYVSDDMTKDAEFLISKIKTPFWIEFGSGK